ncbi:ABC transporter substrate-binding protein [Butyrivibrio sp. LC3010]|uniref:ABC transporter substrate-binding protein n=1 Tax=Butyrivibrio sp. LC3010 TaxID=1280680 RepID=UPI00040A0F50|nr:ABC transporter substrate-binding protein [Butyrivibrio sp. LC3010]
MKRKALSMVLASAMTLSMIAGCGGSGSADTATTSNETTEATESTDSTEATDSATETADATAEEEAAPTADVSSEGEHELSVYAWDKNFNIPALEAAEKAYQTVDPEFKLNIIEQSASSDVENAVTLAANSGDYSQLPDIVLFQDHYIQSYVTNYPDAWIDLEDAGIDWSNLGAEKISYSTIDGKHYGAPVDNGTSIFAYRTDILEECGYTIDDVTGITWDRWLEIGRDVKEKTGKYLLSMDHNGDDLPYMMMQAEGLSQWKDGQPFFVGNEELKQILQVIITGAQDGVIYLCNDWSEYTDTSIIGDQVAGVFNGNWIIPTMEQVAENSGKWQITTIPTLSGKEGYAANGGSSLYVTANCTKPDLAKSFLAYTFGGGDGAMDTYDNALRDGGVIGTCISASKSDVYQEGVDFFNGQSIYADIVSMGANVPVVEQSDYHYNARTYIQAAITNVINGSDLDTELQNAEDQVKFEMGQ